MGESKIQVICPYPALIEFKLIFLKSYFFRIDSLTAFVNLIKNFIAETKEAVWKVIP
jgi:hypothetical protein